MSVVTTRQLLDSGVHFGHQTRRWNPKMKRYILTDRSGIYIIDLQQSLAMIDNAYQFVKDTVAAGGGSSSLLRAGRQPSPAQQRRLALLGKPERFWYAVQKRCDGRLAARAL